MRNHYQKAISIGLSLVLSVSVFAQNQANNFWTKAALPASKSINFNANNQPANTVSYQLNVVALKNSLANAPLRGTTSFSNLIVAFPTKDGLIEQFRVMEAPVMDPILSAKYPSIKSYVGKGVEDPSAVIRFSLSNQKGLSSMIISGTRNTMFIEPNTANLGSYIVYSRAATENRQHVFECLTKDISYQFKKPLKSSNNKDADDQTLRVFRLAMSGTGEYTAYHGGTKADALAAMNATMTRVNGVYENDFAITMVLIANTDNVIYTNASSDPYGSSLNSELQSTLTSVIGESNYDIGHLVHQESNSNGNAGCIGCVCVDGQKGSAFTSHITPQGDFFDIDFVAHEMGHQFGANHTHTHSGFSENTGAQMEPGSGSSIMGYAGITGASSDVQAHSDDYFHFFNIQQVTNYVSTTSCQTTSGLTNAAPIANAGGDYNIPKGTAFILEGSGSDADAGDVLTYCWEQANQGFDASNGVTSSSTTSPNFRSLPPSINSFRYMPKLSDVIAGNLSTTWETVSSVARTMDFALTVRDNVSGGGQNKIDQMIVTVDGASGPFTVTSQTSAISWDEGTTQTITWNVANTTAAPVNAANVDIFLSTDGGYTYPFTLAIGVTNNGTASITVPSGASTTSARVMVRGAGNIFYALNSTNFSITASEFVMAFGPTANTDDVCAPSNASYNFTYNTFLGFNQVTTFSATGNPAGTTVSFSPATAQNTGTPVVVTVSGITSAMMGSYNITITGTAPSPLIVKNTDIVLNVFSSTISASTLSLPVDGASGVSGPYNFSWVADANAITYDIDIATDAAFTTIVENATALTSPNYVATTLLSNSTYFWRVKPNNLCANGSFLTVFSFTSSDCNVYASVDVPVTLPSTGSPTVTSTLDIVGSGIINGLDVVGLIGTHTFINDLKITLTSPQNTTVTLFDRICDAENDFDINFDDTAPAGALPCPPVGGGNYQPQGSLSAFNGESVNGTWTLSVSDAYNQDGGSLDGWGLDICLTSSPTGINENDNYDNVVVFPNPTNNSVTIDLNSIENVENITIVDVQGKLIYENTSITQTQLKIDLNNHSEGIYILKIQYTDAVKTHKIIKQ